IARVFRFRRSRDAQKAADGDLATSARRIRHDDHGFAGGERLAQRIERNIFDGWIRVYPAQTGDRAPELHDRGVCDINTVPGVLSHVPLLSRVCAASGADAICEPGVVSSDLPDHSWHAHTGCGGDRSDGVHDTEPCIEASV